MTAATDTRPKMKTNDWTKPTVLGLILTAVGALGIVSLLPQLNVLPLEQLASNEPFSAPFEITNTGYVAIHIVNVTVIWPLTQYEHQTFIDTSANYVGWDDFDLGRGESKTILPRFARNGIPEKADAVIAVDYQYLEIPGRRMFRFEGIHGERWQWIKQPIGKDEAEFNKEVDHSLNEHQMAIHRIRPN